MKDDKTYLEQKIKEIKCENEKLKYKMEFFDVSLQKKIKSILSS